MQREGSSRYQVLPECDGIVCRSCKCQVLAVALLRLKVSAAVLIEEDAHLADIIARIFSLLPLFIATWPEPALHGATHALQCRSSNNACKAAHQHSSVAASAALPVTAKPSK